MRCLGLLRYRWSYGVFFPIEKSILAWSVSWDNLSCHIFGRHQDSPGLIFVHSPLPFSVVTTLGPDVATIGTEC